jgi:peptidoglycan-N-acetylglucosamine deacetylase
MRLFRPGFFAGWLYSEAIFRIRTDEKVLYLTFDDGPDPLSTIHLLDILEAHDIRALFFCDGRAAEKFPDLINQIRNRGHLIGNHGYNHLDGWRTDFKRYLNDVIRASDFTSGKIFRPPYGRLSVKQKKRLLRSYKIVFWDIMPYDFDISFGRENSLRILKDKIRSGSIIVLHDTPSSSANIIMSDFLTFANSSGYRFELLDVTGDR